MLCCNFWNMVNIHKAEEKMLVSGDIHKIIKQNLSFVGTKLVDRVVDHLEMLITHRSGHHPEQIMFIFSI